MLPGAPACFGQLATRLHTDNLRDVSCSVIRFVDLLIRLSLIC